ncbi:MAG: hypothetical protein ABI675_00875 [Chitinophagaceae bacterium]
MKKTHSFLFALALLFFIISCSKSGSNTGTGGGTPITCDGTAKTFALDVDPIIQSFCNKANCHASGSSNGPGPITNHTQVFNARTAIRGAVASGLMPQNTTLTMAQKTAIVCWIDNGALDN